MKLLKYFDELKRSMEYLAEEPDTVFIGQAVACAGTAMSNTLKDVSPARKVELPVDEDMQMGMTNGLALQGKLPVSIFPRWNFFLLATNQLVNHLDKFSEMSGPTCPTPTAPPPAQEEGAAAGSASANVAPNVVIVNTMPPAPEPPPVVAAPVRVTCTVSW